MCWGQGATGRLGYGNTDNVGDDEVPADVGTVDLGGTAIQLSAGTFGTCAVLDGGELKCWGGITQGIGEIIGDDETPAEADPVVIGGPVERVSVGYTHSCVLLANGRIRCWGRNDSGELGYGHTEYIGDDEYPAAACDVPVM